MGFSRRGKFAAATALLLCLCTAFSGCAGSETATSRQAELRAEAKQYDQAVNEQGIAVDLSENPYYMKEHPEFQYSQPETITYDSEVTGTKRHANILLPADYDADRQYPVLYLLHGLDGSHRTWKNKDGHIILQNLTYLYGVPEMIVVFPNSAVNENENTDGLSLREKVEAYDRTEEDLVTSLMPYINSHYSVKPGRENTAVAGNSMGGRNALNTAFRHPELFGYVGAFPQPEFLGTGFFRKVGDGASDPRVYCRSVGGEFRNADAVRGPSGRRLRSGDLPDSRKYDGKRCGAHILRYGRRPSEYRLAERALQFRPETVRRYGNVILAGSF